MSQRGLTKPVITDILRQLSMDCRVELIPLPLVLVQQHLQRSIESISTEEDREVICIELSDDEEAPIEETTIQEIHVSLKISGSEKISKSISTDNQEKQKVEPIDSSLFAYNAKPICGSKRSSSIDSVSDNSVEKKKRKKSPKDSDSEVTASSSTEIDKNLQLNVSKNSKSTNGKDINKKSNDTSSEANSTSMTEMDTNFESNVNMNSESVKSKEVNRKCNKTKPKQIKNKKPRVKKDKTPKLKSKSAPLVSSAKQDDGPASVDELWSSLGMPSPTERRGDILKNFTYCANEQAPEINVNGMTYNNGSTSSVSDNITDKTVLKGSEQPVTEEPKAKIRIRDIKTLMNSADREPFSNHLVQNSCNLNASNLLAVMPTVQSHQNLPNASSENIVSTVGFANVPAQNVTLNLLSNWILNKELQEKSFNMSLILHFVLESKKVRDIRIDVLAKVPAGNMMCEERKKVDREYYNMLRLRGGEFKAMFGEVVDNLTGPIKKESMIMILYCLIINDLLKHNKMNDQFTISARKIIIDMLKRSNYKDDIVYDLLNLDDSVFVQKYNKVQDIFSHTLKEKKLTSKVSSTTPKKDSSIENNILQPLMNGEKTIPQQNLNQIIPREQTRLVNLLQDNRSIMPISNVQIPFQYQNHLPTISQDVVGYNELSKHRNQSTLEQTSHVPPHYPGSVVHKNTLLSVAPQHCNNQTGAFTNSGQQLMNHVQRLDKSVMMQHSLNVPHTQPNVQHRYQTQIAHNQELSSQLYYQWMQQHSNNVKKGQTLLPLNPQHSTQIPHPDAVSVNTTLQAFSKSVTVQCLQTDVTSTKSVVSETYSNVSNQHGMQLTSVPISETVRVPPNYSSTQFNVPISTGNKSAVYDACRNFLNQSTKQLNTITNQSNTQFNSTTPTGTKHAVCEAYRSSPNQSTTQLNISTSTGTKSAVCEPYRNLPNQPITHFNSTTPAGTRGAVYEAYRNSPNQFNTQLYTSTPAGTKSAAYEDYRNSLNQSNMQLNTTTHAGTKSVVYEACKNSSNQSTTHLNTTIPVGTKSAAFEAYRHLPNQPNTQINVPTSNANRLKRALVYPIVNQPSNPKSHYTLKNKPTSHLLQELLQGSVDPFQKYYGTSNNCKNLQNNSDSRNEIVRNNQPNFTPRNGNKPSDFNNLRQNDDQIKQVDQFQTSSNNYQPLPPQINSPLNVPNSVNLNISQSMPQKTNPDWVSNVQTSQNSPVNPNVKRDSVILQNKGYKSKEGSTKPVDSDNIDNRSESTSSFSSASQSTKPPTYQEALAVLQHVAEQKLTSPPKNVQNDTQADKYSVNKSLSISELMSATCMKESCTNEATLLCSGCQRAVYCSRKCQDIDWYYNHHTICKSQELASASSKEIVST